MKVGKMNIHIHIVVKHLVSKFEIFLFKIFTFMNFYYSSYDATCFTMMHLYFTNLYSLWNQRYSRNAAGHSFKHCLWEFKNLQNLRWWLMQSKKKLESQGTMGLQIVISYRAKMKHLIITCILWAFLIQMHQDQEYLNVSKWKPLT